MKRLVSLLSFFLALLILGMPLAVFAAPSETPAATEQPEEADLKNADTVLLYCIETDTVLREKNAHQAVYPGAAVKLMTALLAYEMIDDLKTEITVTAEMVAGVSGSYYGFGAGDTVSVEDLLKLLLLRKSNDAAMILAHAAAGDVDSFVTAMNEKAKQLGMENTFFSNCTGLHDSSMTTTAHDLLVLSLAFYSNIELQGWSGSDYLSCESLGRTIYNNNYFLSRYYNGTGVSYLFDAVTGLINGGTTQSGEVLITSATYNGLHYIVVLLGGKTVEDLPTCYDTTKELLMKDTQNFAYIQVLLNADVICELPVKLGSGVDYAAVFPKESIECYLSKYIDREKLTQKMDLSVETLEAPIQEGDKVGTIAVYYEDKLLGETDLVVRSNITRSGAEYRLAQITRFLSSRRFLIIALSVIGLFLTYFVVNAIYREQVRRKYRSDRY